jgi:hypothetical protein
MLITWVLSWVAETLTGDGYHLSLAPLVGVLIVIAPFASNQYAAGVVAKDGA